MLIKLINSPVKSMTARDSEAGLSRTIPFMVEHDTRLPPDAPSGQQPWQSADMPFQALIEAIAPARSVAGQAVMPPCLEPDLVTARVCVPRGPMLLALRGLLPAGVTAAGKPAVILTCYRQFGPRYSIELPPPALVRMDFDYPLDGDFEAGDVRARRWFAAQVVNACAGELREQKLAEGFRVTVILPAVIPKIAAFPDQP